MRTRAPGKIVISGAYSVLEGAPAIVAAVDRFAWADTRRPPPMVTAEVEQAMREEQGIEQAPWFDAAELRDTDRKLGLGSSAAILVASLGACLLEQGLAAEQLAGEVFRRAVRAHRAAQGGGSGIDVAASCYGGVIRCLLDAASGELSVRPQGLPERLCIEVFSCPTAAETRLMLQAVKELKQSRPRRYWDELHRAGDGARQAVEATTTAELIAALEQQLAAFRALGQAAGVAIVTAEIDELATALSGSGSCFVPSGAGGGDVALYVGQEPSSQELREHAARLGAVAVELRIGAAGLCAVADEDGA